MNFYWACGLHVVLGGCWVGVDFPFWSLFPALAVPGVVYPWFFAQYERVEPIKGGERDERV